MSRPSIYVVDPSPARYRELRRRLKKDFVLHHSRSVAGAGAAVRRSVPRAILASLDQVHGNGLALCQTLREAVGDRCRMVVYGKPEGEHPAKALDRVMRSHGVDYFLAEDLHGRDLAEVLRAHLNRLLAAERVPFDEEETRCAPVVCVYEDEPTDIVSKARAVVPGAKRAG